MAHLMLVRHGESEWNAKGLWTGLTDIALSEKGRQEAKDAALKITQAGLSADIAFTSVLSRAWETLTIILDSLKKTDVLILKDKALNERDYGVYTGKNKWDIKRELGDEKFLELRRSFDYPIDQGESLKDVYERVVPYYKDQIEPKLKEEKNVLIAAHGNSLRALMKFLEEISDEDIAGVEIPTGGVIVYEVKTSGEILKKEVL